MVIPDVARCTVPVIIRCGLSGSVIRRIKVSLSQNRPREALRAPEGVEAPRIPGQPALEDDKVLSPVHRPPLPPGDIPDTRFS